MNNYIVNIIRSKKVIYITRSERYLHKLIPIPEEAFHALLQQAAGYKICEVDEARFKTNEFMKPRSP